MIIDQVKEVLKIEAQGILDLVDRIGPDFEKAVTMILEAKGRVILTGMAKTSPMTFLEGSNPNLDNQYRSWSSSLRWLFFTIFNLIKELKAASTSLTNTFRFAAM